MKKIILLLVLVLLVVSLSGCMADLYDPPTKPAGFFTGVWHGWIAPFSLIIGIFSKGIRIYEVVNVGWWYDLGFYMAIISGFGGISFSRNRRNKNKYD